MDVGEDVDGFGDVECGSGEEGFRRMEGERKQGDKEEREKKLRIGKAVRRERKRDGRRSAGKRRYLISWNM